MFGADFQSERATSIDDYKLTCIQFIEDISADYKAWVNRYRLPMEERAARMNSIESVVKTTNEWIGKFGNTIKRIDIIKDDGINKMAEFTAGFPFTFIINIGQESRYVHTSSGQIELDVHAKPREDRKIRIGYWTKDQFVQLLASCAASINPDQIDFQAKDVLNERIILDASSSKSGDIISITMVTEEVANDLAEKRGLSTLIRIR